MRIVWTTDREISSLKMYVNVSSVAFILCDKQRRRREEKAINANTLSSFGSPVTSPANRLVSRNSIEIYWELPITSNRTHLCLLHSTLITSRLVSNVAHLVLTTAMML